MSVPVTVTITGCQSMANLEQALSVARNFQPMTREQKLAVLEKTAPVASRRKVRSLQVVANLRRHGQQPAMAGLRTCESVQQIRLLADDQVP